MTDQMLPSPAPVDESTSPTAAPDLAATVRARWAACTRSDRFMLMAVALLPLSVDAGGYSDPRIQRVALAALVGVPGLAITVDQAVRRRDRAAAALLGFLVVAVVAAVASPGVWLSLHNSYFYQVSVFAFAISLGWWGVGRTASPTAVSSIGWALLPGALLNGLFATLQVAFGSTPFPGRGAGLASNPVYLASFIVGPLVWSIAVAASRRRVGWWLPVVSALGFSAGVTGSRAALLSIVIAGGLLVAVHRGRSTLLALGVALGGFVGASLYGTWVASAGAVDRLGDASGGLDQRVDVWWYGVKAFTERPVIGWGIGHYATATQRYFTPEFIRSIGYDDLSQPYTDPHNLAVLLLTSTGVLGVVTFSLFLVTAVRGRRNWELLAAAVAIAITWGLQPATVHSFPLAALLLGAAARSEQVRGDVVPTARWRAVTAAALVVGASSAVYLVASDTFLRVALRSDPAAVERAASWFHRDPRMAMLVGDYYRQRAVADPDDVDAERRMLEWSERLVSWEPNSAPKWTYLADSQFIAGDLDAVPRSLDRAIEIQPYNPTAWRLRLHFARVVGDAEAEREALETVCELGFDLCDQGARVGAP